ncbi:hypothetical protein P170DRAFT_439424 [Aspergillus steynii IBT 23096]|uniref:Secreted protein n=1 Tax=Aspergillus steynii IBT 23096 TaxID=1392250 RepID=A0A2I2FYH8_9EURO|nr:uncharacterized protein P170DRAFT_439424 [Aspergillus steynii IBT 23096]PLB45690.1 hypothetical protein P170DRAFT_439424 [Aspergillus steynii IBT 23096]
MGSMDCDLWLLMHILLFLHFPWVVSEAYPHPPITPIPIHLQSFLHRRVSAVVRGILRYGATTLRGAVPAGDMPVLGGTGI